MGIGRFFKKVSRGANKFFKKAGEGISDTFKKNGYLSDGLGYVNKGLQMGGKVLNTLDKIPILGAALSPLTAVARTGLNMGNQLVAGVSGGQGLINGIADSIKHKNVNGVKSGIAQLARDSHGVAKDLVISKNQLVGQAKDAGKYVKSQSAANLLEKVKNLDKPAEDSVTFV